jgi:hypothetical protein
LEELGAETWVLRSASGCGEGVVEVLPRLGNFAVVLVDVLDAQSMDDGFEGVGQAGQVAAAALLQDRVAGVPGQQRQVARVDVDRGSGKVVGLGEPERQ